MSTAQKNVIVDERWRVACLRAGYLCANGALRQRFHLLVGVAISDIDAAANVGDVRGAPFTDVYSGVSGHRYAANDGRPPFAPQHAHARIFGGHRAFYFYDTHVLSTISVLDFITGQMQ